MVCISPSSFTSSATSNYKELEYCNRFDQSIVRQRLGKQVRTHAPHINMVEVLSVWSAPCNSTSTVFSVRSAVRLYNGSLFTAEMRYLSTDQYKVKTRETGDRLAIELENWVEFWIISSPRCLNKKWQKDFVMILSDSSCVGICCQETTSGN
jgi:hypothetical protein